MSDRIVCKPTPWFLFRAGAMFVMFSVFAVLFYIDGKTGYREKNLSFYMWQTVERAAGFFGEMQDRMGPEEWRTFAAEKRVFNEEIDMSTLPEGTDPDMAWPELLRDYEAMEAGLSNPRRELFDRYRDQAGLTKDAPEMPYSAKKIFEQWVVFWICGVLAVITLFFLLRTLSRQMVYEDGVLMPPQGKAVAISDLVRLDLRRWQSKGLAFAWAAEKGGKERKIRIDGLTYGGFKSADGQPAERLLEQVKSRFSGELIEYEPVGAEEAEQAEQAEQAEEAEEAPPSTAATTPAEEGGDAATDSSAQAAVDPGGTSSADDGGEARRAE